MWGATDRPATITCSWIVGSWIVGSWIVGSWIVGSWIVGSWIVDQIEMGSPLTFEDIGKLLTIFSMAALGIAVANWIAGQIRQYAREARLAALQNTTDRTQRWSSEIARDADLARIYSDGLADPGALTRIDLVRFEALAFARFRNWEDEFLSFARGLADKEVFAGRRAAFKDALNESGIRWYWDRRRSHFAASFAKFVDHEIASLKAGADASRAMGVDTLADAEAPATFLDEPHQPRLAELPLPVLAETPRPYGTKVPQPVVAKASQPIVVETAPAARDFFRS